MSGSVSESTVLIDVDELARVDGDFEADLSLARRVGEDGGVAGAAEGNVSSVHGAR